MTNESSCDYFSYFFAVDAWLKPGTYRHHQRMCFLLHDICQAITASVFSYCLFMGLYFVLSSVSETQFDRVKIT